MGYKRNPQVIEQRARTRKAMQKAGHRYALESGEIPQSALPLLYGDVKQLQDALAEMTQYGKPAQGYKSAVWRLNSALESTLALIAQIKLEQILNDGFRLSSPDQKTLETKIMKTVDGFVARQAYR